MQALLGCPDSYRGQAVLALTQLLLRGGGCILNERQALLGLQDVVRDLGEGALGIL